MKRASKRSLQNREISSLAFRRTVGVHKTKWYFHFKFFEKPQNCFIYILFQHVISQSSMPISQNCVKIINPNHCKYNFENEGEAYLIESIVGKSFRHEIQILLSIYDEETLITFVSDF